jgi:hypothetical protein
MDQKEFQDKLKTFFKKTGDDLRRSARDIREEGEKLLKEVQDPERQARVRDGLREVGVWAKKTAIEVADLVEVGVKKAEGALNKAGDKVNDFAVGSAPKEAPAPVEEPRHDTPADPIPAAQPSAPRTAARKSIGSKKRAPKAKPAGVKKTVGKKQQNPEG